MASKILLVSDLPADILNRIQERLPLADYLRFPAVCRSFRSAAKQISHLPFSDTHVPWLLSFTCLYGSNFTAEVVSLSPSPKTYSIPFPPLFEDFSILSAAKGHYLFIENQSDNCRKSQGIYIVNPFDSWAQLGSLPPSPSSLGGIFNLTMNSANTIVVGIYGQGLAYTRTLDGDRRSWISLNDTLPPPTHLFQDVIAYKDDLFYAVQMDGTSVLALDFSSPTTAVRVTDMTLNLQICRGVSGWKCFQSARLVNSPSGLFLVRWRCLLKTGETRRREIDVYRLMDDEYAPNKWVQINSLDSFSFFCVFYSSISLSAADFPGLRTNCIYLPQDALWNVRYDLGEVKDNVEDDIRHLIYDLGDGSWDQFYDNDSFDGLWITPCLRKNNLLLPG